MTEVKTCFDWKMFDVANWVACLNRENGPGGTPSHEALSGSSQGALEISSVAGQPPSLDRDNLSTLRLVAESLKHDEKCRLSSQRPQYPTLYRHLKLPNSASCNGQFFTDTSNAQTVLVARDNSTVVAYINKQGGTHSA